MNDDDKKFWTCVALAARRLGIDPLKTKSWEDLAATVVKAMDSECCVCRHRPSNALGMFEPRDPNELRLLYVICDPDKHTTKQVEDALRSNPILAPS